MQDRSSFRTARAVLLGFAALAMVLPSVAPAQKFKVLYNFSGEHNGGWQPEGTPIWSGGALYGTTYKGGLYSAGTAYRLQLTTNKLKVLHNFGKVAADGSNPQDNLIQNASGTFYGITAAGGAAFSGSIYEFTVKTGQPLAYSVIAPFEPNFDSGGLIVEGPPAIDGAGNIYGVTHYGSTMNSGTIWEVDATGKLSSLHTFGGAGDGSSPVGGLIYENGALYGATSAGGANGFGAVFAYNLATNQESVVYSFKGGLDGAQPGGGVISDGGENLYGVTYGGGSLKGTGAGTVYRVSVANGTEQIQHVFTGTQALPEGSLIRDKRGDLYGTTSYQGGTVYKLTPAGNITTLHSFNIGTSGEGTVNGLSGDPRGNLYGVTRQLGNAGCGGKGCGQIYQISK